MTKQQIETLKAARKEYLARVLGQKEFREARKWADYEFNSIGSDGSGAPFYSRLPRLRLSAVGGIIVCQRNGYYEDDAEVAGLDTDPFE